MSAPNKCDNTPTDKLAKDLADLEAEIAMFAEEVKAIKAEIAKRFDADIKALYVAAQKAHGKVTFDAKGYEAPFALEVDTRQTVKWDQAKLRAAGDTMKPEEAQHIIDVELSVSEKTYNALPPGDVKKALTDARTTKLSAPSIKVVFPK